VSGFEWSGSVSPEKVEILPNYKEFNTKTRSHLRVKPGFVCFALLGWGERGMFWFRTKIVAEEVG